MVRLRSQGPFPPDVRRCAIAFRRGRNDPAGPQRARCGGAISDCASPPRRSGTRRSAAGTPGRNGVHAASERARCRGHQVRAASKGDACPASAADAQRSGRWEAGARRLIAARAAMARLDAAREGHDPVRPRAGPAIGVREVPMVGKRCAPVFARVPAAAAQTHMAEGCGMSRPLPGSQRERCFQIRVSRGHREHPGSRWTDPRSVSPDLLRPCAKPTPSAALSDRSL